MHEEKEEDKRQALESTKFFLCNVLTCLGQILSGPFISLPHFQSFASEIGDFKLVAARHEGGKERRRLRKRRRQKSTQAHTHRQGKNEGGGREGEKERERGGLR